MDNTISEEALAGEKKAETDRRLKPTHSTFRYLYLHSGNQCALAECNESLIDTKGSWVGEVAHIHAASDGGPRADKRLTREQRRSQDNLMLLCSNCHKRIDRNPDQYPAEMLKEAKAKHEGRFKQGLGSAEFKDSSDQDEIVIPTSFGVWGIDDSDGDIAEYRESVENTANRFSKLPVGTRQFLAHAVRRSNPCSYASDRLQVLAQELLGVIVVEGFPLSEEQLRLEMDILEQHDFAYWDQDGDIRTGYLNIDNDDASVLLTAFDLAKEQVAHHSLPDLEILEDVIVRLDFTSFQ